MDAPRPSRTPATERVTLYCTWRPSALTTRPRKQVIIYLTKKQNSGSLSNCHYRMVRTKNLPWPAPNIWLRMFQISSKSVHYRRSCSRTREGSSLGPQSMCNIESNWTYLDVVRHCLHVQSLVEPSLCASSSFSCPFSLTSCCKTKYVK